jgi:hypothetical protein
MRARVSRLAVLLVAVLPMITSAGPARAQSAAASGATIPVAPAYSDFFELAHPGELDLIAFGGGFRSDQYAVTQQGFQFEQTITRYVGLVGRATGYQLYEGEGFDNPLNPGTGHQARLNFGRFQGGIDLALYPQTHLYLLGGKDVADSHAVDFESDFSTWLWRYSSHPLNTLVVAVWNSQNHVTSSEIDLRAVVASTADFMFLAGGGGAIYGGGFVSGLDGQGGPDAGVYHRRWGIGLDAQGGYGSAGAYGQISLYKVFSLADLK